MGENSVSKLQQAINGLQIKDVFLVASASEINADFEPKYIESEEQIAVEYKHVVDRSTTVSFSNGDDTLNFFRVYVELGARWVSTSEEDETDSGSGDKVHQLAKIEACFVAEYHMNSEIPKDALEEFALKNASYHIWPYWREYLMNHAMRMNLPKVALPIVQFVINGNNH